MALRRTALGGAAVGSRMRQTGYCAKRSLSIATVANASDIIRRHRPFLDARVQRNRPSFCAADFLRGSRVRVLWVSDTPIGSRVSLAFPGLYT